MLSLSRHARRDQTYAGRWVVLIHLPRLHFIPLTESNSRDRDDLKIARSLSGFHHLAHSIYTSADLQGRADRMAVQPKHRQLPDKETKLFKELLVSSWVITVGDL
jgi:hypothetical protein